VIASISGTVIDQGSDSLTIEVAGLGFEILVPASHIRKFKLGEQAKLMTRMVVREDAISLFGFESGQERDFFDALCSISGIGPKLALAVLSHLGVGGVATALASQDEQALRSVPGVGQKTARLILVSLADRAIAVAGGRSNLVGALLSLGVSEAEAQSLASKVDPALEDAAALRAALKLRGGIA
jgi:Holliday junction DNA helicase RuvA